MLATPDWSGLLFSGRSADCFCELSALPRLDMAHANPFEINGTQPVSDWQLIHHLEGIYVASLRLA